MSSTTKEQELTPVPALLKSKHIRVVRDGWSRTRLGGSLIEKMNKSDSLEVEFPINIPNNTIMAGLENQNSSSNERYLTIGISSVWRNESYIIKTINSIINQSTPEQRSTEIYLFLLLADEDHQTRSDRAANLSVLYSAEVASGFLRILQPPDELYPNINFTTLRRTYNDPAARVKWRSKQVLDFSFLFWYTWTQQPSLYYLILEDDVVCANNYLQAIKDHVNKHQVHHWVTLQFADFIGIGRLLHVSDLYRLVQFLLQFYRENPWDMLLAWWSHLLMVPEPPPKHLYDKRSPGIFQHIGVNSTLTLKNTAKRKPVIDKHFKAD
ncbi:unnamed protein product, partial [Meganyctiphanes norvegica]